MVTERDNVSEISVWIRDQQKDNVENKSLVVQECKDDITEKQKAVVLVNTVKTQRERESTRSVLEKF